MQRNNCVQLGKPKLFVEQNLSRKTQKPKVKEI